MSLLDKIDRPLTVSLRVWRMAWWWSKQWHIATTKLRRWWNED